MKVFVAGATGVLGSRVVPLLVEAGHEVTGIARGADKASQVRAAGATPVNVDLFDADAVRAAVAGHDAVCNLATHIPPTGKAWRQSAWEQNDRIRTEGSRHLVDAALAGGVDRFVQESISLLYADGGEDWLDENAPVAMSPLTQSAGIAERQAARVTDAGGTGVVLRFAMFYASGSSHTELQLRLARQGIAPVVGGPRAYQAMVHIDDAASAVVAALSAPPGIYNVTEDRPATRAEQAAAIASALGTGPGWMMPPSVVKWGGKGTAPLTSSQRVSNRRFRQATGWAPDYPDGWAGWPQVVDGSGGPPANPRGRRLFSQVALAFLAANAALIGLWAAFKPGSFYAGFPGFGRHWVSVDGPYNQHLVRDVGDLTLALFCLTVVAACSHRRSMVRTAGVAWLVSALPHFIYHLTHRTMFSAGDQIVSLSGLAVECVLATAMIILAPPTRVFSRPPVPPPARGRQPGPETSDGRRQSAHAPAGLGEHR